MQWDAIMKEGKRSFRYHESLAIYTLMNAFYPCHVYPLTKCSRSLNASTQLLTKLERQSAGILPIAYANPSCTVDDVKHTRQSKSDITTPDYEGGKVVKLQVTSVIQM